MNVSVAISPEFTESDYDDDKYLAASNKVHSALVELVKSGVDSSDVEGVIENALSEALADD